MNKQEHMRNTGECPDCFSNNLHRRSNGVYNCRTCNARAANARNAIKRQKAEAEAKLFPILKKVSKQEHMRTTGECPACSSKDLRSYKRASGRITLECRPCMLLKASKRRKEEGAKPWDERNQHLMRTTGICNTCNGTRIGVYKRTKGRKRGTLVAVCFTCEKNKRRKKAGKSSVNRIYAMSMRDSGKCHQCDSDDLGLTKKGRLYCKNCMKLQRENLSERYIRVLINSETGMRGKAVPENAIILKRAMLGFKRELKKWKEATNDSRGV